MRDLFLLDPKVIFLNHGSFGACPKQVFEKYQGWQLALETQPVAFLGRRAPELIRNALHDVGKYLGTSGENLMFVHNATTGINTVARSLHLQPGDEILTTTHEYGALEKMWKYQQREHGIQIVHQDLPLPLVDEEAVADAIWAGVTKRTRILYLSHVTSPTALILPVAELCRRARAAGIMTIIDGAHVPGNIPLNLDELNVDFYSGNCHKWMSAPKGSAFLYVNPEYQDIVEPMTISHGYGSETFFDRTQWQGTQDISAYLTVPEAIRFMEQHNWDSVRERCHELAIETMHRICEVSGKPPIAMPRFFGQMITAPLPDDADTVELKEKLYEEYQVEVPVFQHRGNNYVRVSVQGYTTKQDIDTFIRGLAVLL